VQNKPVKFFGYSFAVVLTGSMEPEIMTGDLIIFKSCDASDINVGDDIVFIAGSGFDKLEGQSIVHRVIEVVEDNSSSSQESKSVSFRTQGINNFSADKDVVTESNLLGVCIYNSAFWGGVFTFFSKYGVIILIALIALPFIVKQIIKIVKLSKDDNREQE
jgi:signal peptidase